MITAHVKEVYATADGKQHISLRDAYKHEIRASIVSILEGSETAAGAGLYHSAMIIKATNYPNKYAKALREAADRIVAAACAATVL